MPAAPTLLAGRYRLRESLGVGGMGQVWLARDETLDRDVAVKEITPPPELQAADRDVAQRRTLREARAAARLNHRHVVQVYDVLEAGGHTWIVMEYVPSRSLQQVITTDGPLEPARAARIGLAVLSALEAAHRAGVWHRDVKPANVLLGHDGRVVLTDFGIATIEGDAQATGSGGPMIGSPEYMSPERARKGTAGPAADLWSLGATLYAAVEGRSPYRRGSVIGTLTALAAEEPDPPRQAGALKPVLDGLLRTDPTARTDFAETRRRLEVAARSADPAPPVRARATWPVVPPPRQRPPAAPAPPAPEESPAAPAPVSPSAPAPVSRSAPAPPVSPPAGHAASPTASGPVSAAPDRPPAPPRVGTAPLPPAAAPPSRGRRRALVVVLAMIVALSAAAVAWFAVRPDPGTSAQDTPARGATSAPADGNPAAANTATPPAGGSDGSPVGAAPAGTATTSPPAAGAEPGGDDESDGGGDDGGGGARPALPAGWREHRDPTGFSVYVPVGWRQSREGSMVYFRDPRTGRVLGIDQTDRPKADPVADWRGQADYRVRRGDFPGYDEIKIVAVDYWLKAADWEFTFDGRNRRHVNNRGFVVSAHQAYGIYWQTSDAEWDDARDDLQLVFDSFRPAGD